MRNQVRHYSDSSLLFYSLRIRRLADLVSLNNHFFQDFPLEAHDYAADRDFALGAVCGFRYMAQEPAAAGNLHDHHADGLYGGFIY